MRFRDLPIKGKLIGVIFLTSISVLVLTCLALLVYEIHSYKQTTSRSLATMAEIIAANSASALIFDDPKVAREILSGLRAEEEVTAAAIYDANGKIYATYPATLSPADFPATPEPDGTVFKPNDVRLSRPVLQQDRRVGTIFLRADPREMYRRITVYGLVLLVVLIGSGGVALFLSNLFQQQIFRPLNNLAGTARIVSEKKDYSVRAAVTSNDEVGELTKAFNSMLDQIQASHSALRESETRLSAVFNQAGAGIAQCSLTGRFMMVNDRFCEITGQDRKNLLTLAMQEITHPDDLSQHEHRFHEIARGSASVAIEKRYVREQGHMVWVRENIVPLRNSRGEVESILAVTQDITERKRAEQELERARDAAERANRAKDDFLAALSHELRTPLNPVLLLASDAAANEKLPPAVRADFETIAKNVALEARLIDDLLDVTRIIRGKLPLEQSAIDVHAVLRDAIGTVEAELSQKRITLQCDLKAERHTVFADTVRLQQIFWNVLKNAVKFTPERGEIAIRTECNEEDAIAITVSDTGIGMTADELAGVFEAFRQGDHASNPDWSGHRFGGLGLGLAITRMLVELHSGSIRASSSGRNAGSTFVITLPLTKVEKTPGEPESGNGHAAAPHAGGIRILLVEDHEPTRKALTQLLKRRRFHVEAAGSLAEARALAEKHDFHLLISDIGLPDGDGYALMMELGSRRPVKGIALTGYGMEHDVAFSQAAGFVAHLTKPVRVQSLEAALAMALPQQQPASNSFTPPQN